MNFHRGFKKYEIRVASGVIALLDEWFISDNLTTPDDARANRTNRVVCGDDNWNIGVRNIPDSVDQRNLCQFFIRPDLFIEIRQDEPETFRPELEMPQPLNVKRQHFKVRVVNRGKGVATECIAKLRIIRWTANALHPSTDSKVLRWDDGAHAKTIYPRGEEENLNVIFADSDFPLHGDQEVYAFVTTSEAFNNRMNRAQDGFGLGDFEAELSIRSKEWGHCQADLTIHIDRDHHNTNIRLSRWDRIIIGYKRRPSIIKFISRSLRRWLS